MDDYKYGRYISRNQETRWATIDEIKNSSTYINVSDDNCPAGGLPLLSNGKDVYVDAQDTHTLIFGATGSKKSRLFCMPMINIFAKAGESFVVTDPKGELYAKTSGLVKAKGYQTIVLNFRDIGHGDTWNPLSLPYSLYHSGQEEAAISMLNDFIATIAAPHQGGTLDRFWIEMAASFALANLMLLLECGTESQANVANMATLCSAGQKEYLQELAAHMSNETIAGINYKSVLSAAENTQKSISVQLYSMLRIFNTQKNLVKMLSSNSVDLRNIGREKTAVYLIIPDEKTTYHFLATTFIKQVYEILITEAQKEADFRLPVRVNFVLDEFCNMPKIPDMPAMISAARSRNMRFYLVAQSMHQLQGKYGEDANTIKGNCDNWVFLTSKELSLLNEISELCGSVTSAGNATRRLISVSELQRLNKEKGEVLIMHARQYPFITEIADIDSYDSFKGYESVALQKSDNAKESPFSLSSLLDDIKWGRRPWPFTEEGEDYIDEAFLRQISSRRRLI